MSIIISKEIKRVFIEEEKKVVFNINTKGEFTVKI